MALIAARPCLHQTVIDSLVVGGDDLRTYQSCHSLVCLPDGIPVLLSATGTDGEHLDTEFRHTPYAKDRVLIKVVPASITLSHEDGRLIKTGHIDLAGYSTSLANRLFLPTAGWLAADAAQRLCMVQAFVQEAVAPRQQQLRGLAERLALHRWTGLVQSGAANAPTMAHLRQDGRVHWQERIPNSTQMRDLSRTLMSQRRRRNQPDIGGMVQDLYEFPDSLSDAMGPYKGATLPPEPPARTAHQHLQDRQELLEDWASLGFDLTDQI